MKKILFVLFAITTAAFCYANTETITWYTNGQTYTTTTCESGSDIILPAAPTKTGYNFVGWLPYIPVEYLTFTGTQGIPSSAGAMPSSKYIHIKAGISVSRANTYQNIIFTKAVAFENSNLFLYRDSNTYVMLTSNGHVSVNKKYDIDYTITPTTIRLKSENLSVSKSGSFTLSDDTKLYIGSYGYKPNFQGKIYYVQSFDENGVLLADLIPVLDTNNVPCMYDKVSQQFLYNDLPGALTAGPILK